MRKITVSLAVVAGVLCSPAAVVEPTENPGSPAEPEKNVIEKIVEESAGTVEIDIPEDVLREILKEEQPKTVQRQQKQTLRPGINKVSGFRIQVFSDGRNQGSLESRAKARGSAIVAKFPKYRGQVYTFSSSPNWYTRIGNFKTSAEASSALAELKRAFPQYANEMRVVKSQIVVIK